MKQKLKNFISNINMKYLFVIVPLILIGILIVISSVFGIINDSKKESEIKTIILKTKDNKVSLEFNESFTKEEIGEYDLYAKDSKRQLITGIFTYNLSEYNENSAKEILDNQVEYFKKTRNDMIIYKNETINDFDDKIVTRVEYSGKAIDSSNCIYIFSVIEFKNNPDYVLYSNQVLIKDDYEKYSKELIKIINDAKLE